MRLTIPTAKIEPNRTKYSTKLEDLVRLNL